MKSPGECAKGKGCSGKTIISLAHSPLIKKNSDRCFGYSGTSLVFLFIRDRNVNEKPESQSHSNPRPGEDRKDGLGKLVEKQIKAAILWTVFPPVDKDRTDGGWRERKY